MYQKCCDYDRIITHNSYGLTSLKNIILKETVRSSPTCTVTNNIIITHLRNQLRCSQDTPGGSVPGQSILLLSSTSAKIGPNVLFQPEVGCLIFLLVVDAKYSMMIVR
jgi:hypothetical protein